MPWDLRTTVAVERLNRALHLIVRQVVLFHSYSGPKVRAYLVLLGAGQVLFAHRDNPLEMPEKQLAAA